MKRQRGRGRKVGNSANRSMESNGPEVKIRGTAAQIYEKYMQYARDSQTSGDRVRAENLFQHAEHYYRMMAASMPKDRPPVVGTDYSQNDENENENDNEGDNDALKVVDASDNDSDDADTDDNAHSDAASDEPSRNPRRRRPARRKPTEDAKPDREARSALDALAKEQAAIAQD